jgi:hypothetical protein
MFSLQELFEQRLVPPPSYTSTMDSVKRTRGTAGQNEVKDINAIIDGINNSTPAGLQIKAAFKERFGKEITGARARKGANRNVHYDLEIQIDQEWKTVEHKGSATYKVPGPNEKPWVGGVQFFNGGSEKYRLAKKYAAAWYDMYVKSDVLKTEFGLSSSTPSLEEWFAKDCKAQGDPKTSFGKELKAAVRLRDGPRASLLSKREKLNEALEITDQDKAELVEDVLPIANHVLEQKDYWLAVFGDLEGRFNAVWYPKFTINAIDSVLVSKSKDIVMAFRGNDGFEFAGILRWGKGAGLSNLRLDLK